MRTHFSKLGVAELLGPDDKNSFLEQVEEDGEKYLPE